MSDDTTGVIPPAPPSTAEPQPAGPAKAAPASPKQKPAAAEPSSAASADRPKGGTYFGWVKSDLLLLCILAAVALGWLGWEWARLSGWGAQPIEIERHESRKLDYQIDINSATWVEWIQFEGIGEKLAGRIVADRKRNGPFQSVDDLARVKGIGPKTIARLRPHLKAGNTPPRNGE